MKEKISPKRIVILSIWSIFLFLLFLSPLPYVYNAPGEVIPASQVVDVEKGINDHRGQFFITTVIFSRANLILLMNHYLRPGSDIIPYPYGLSEVEMMAQSAPDPDSVLLEESFYRAKLFALQKMGYNIPLQFDGAQVTAHLHGSKSRGILTAGDVITEIDGFPVKHQKNIHAYTNRNIGKKEKFHVTFIRKGKKITADVTPIRDGMGRASLGTYFQVYLKRYDLPVVINLKPAGFTGSSAGLPVFLEILHQLNKEDIAHGKKIAASGELSEIGTVRPVIGVKYKVRGAERAGCEYFICAARNYEDAKKEAKNIKVIPVENINQAVDVLKTIGSGS